MRYRIDLSSLFNHTNQFFLFLLLCCCLTACQHMPQQDRSKLTWQQQQRLLHSVRAWDIRGKFSFHHHNTTVGSFRWQQSAHANYLIDFFGPLHFGHASLLGYEKKVIFSQGNAGIDAKGLPASPLSSQRNSRLVGSSPESLLSRTLGWQTPVSPLRYWIKGALVPGYEAKITYDAFGRLVRVNQMGWQIGLSDYIEVSGVFLPRRLTLKRGNFWGKLVIQNWYLPK